jgi:hypothetical protein
MVMFLGKGKEWCVILIFDFYVKQSLYTPWRRLGGEEV